MRSNVSSKMLYSTYESEILKNKKTTNSKLIFLSNSKKLITRMCKQGGRIKTFSHTLAKAFGRHFQTFHKLFPTSSKVIEPLRKQQIVKHPRTMT